jgi:hypothetical protein
MPSSLDAEILNWVLLAKGGPGSGRHAHESMAKWHESQYKFHKKVAEDAHKASGRLIRKSPIVGGPEWKPHMAELGRLHHLENAHILAANAHAVAYRMHKEAAQGITPEPRLVFTHRQPNEISQMEDVNTPEQASVVAGQLTNKTGLVTKGGPGSGPRPKGLEAKHREMMRYHDHMAAYHRKEYSDAMKRGDRKAGMDHRQAGYAHMDAKFVHMEVADRLKRGENVTPADRQEAWDFSDAAGQLTEGTNDLPMAA